MKDARRTKASPGVELEELRNRVKSLKAMVARCEEDQERLRRRHSASLLLANGLVYVLSDKGTMTIVKPGEKFEVVARNELGENARKRALKELTWQKQAVKLRDFLSKLLSDLA